ncbi:DUF58 domain-containing protein [Paenibacillus sp. NEAU-GSW1]|uniref:DUF58 domain-containing protein n=1 Tax=Paenibacillus sp. NEAU-GSW1 TaxID=2682486 RepID=UPI0012E1B3BB|nr:DUF58 domain-containing protein [Paenibacillus sp. NEAU-GSW1]MUT66453.1 DUF58 domain-containing protein [Paenibacillus sp. NEAU-GSW1]
MSEQPLIEQHASDSRQNIKLLFPDVALLARLEQLSVAAGSRIKGTMAGKLRSSSLGGSQEFADYRPYAPGDDIRRLDWNVYGRTGRAYMRQYWDEQELSVNLLIDVSRSMTFGGTDNKLHYAVRLAACIAYASLSGEDRIALKLYGDSRLENQLMPVRGKASLPIVFSMLAETIRKEEKLRSALSDAASAHTPPSLSMSEAINAAGGKPFKSGVAFLLTDAMYEEGIEEALTALLAAGQKIVFIHLLSPDELEPDLSGELKLIDSELGTGKDIAVSAPLIDKYKRAVDGYRQYLRQLCGERGIDYLFIDTGRPLSQAVQRDLLQRGVLRSK